MASIVCDPVVLRTGSPSLSADLPCLTSEGETSVTNLFIAGELGGLALIRNAVRQGRECINVIAERLPIEPVPGVYDVVIVGAGPAGISAALRCIKRNMNYIVIEREMIGGTVAKYPRQKLVLTGAVDVPLYGSFKKMQLSKENLLSFWKTIAERPDFRAQLNEPVEGIRKLADGAFAVTTSKGNYKARAVVLALGRNGIPRKLDVPGEELPKVMYRLIEADHYTFKKILVVGGGDSALEAAVGLSLQKGNTVTLSYRGSSFMRIKERNSQRLREAERAGRIRVIFNSVPVEFREQSVLLDVGGTIQDLPKDFVWIFAGGIAPNEFLKKCGVGFGPQDLTVEASRAALLVHQ